MIESINEEKSRPDEKLELLDDEISLADDVDSDDESDEWAIISPQLCFCLTLENKNVSFL